MTTPLDQTRAEFEAWHAREHYPLDAADWLPDGTPRVPAVQGRWEIFKEAWQAATASRAPVADQPADAGQRQWFNKGFEWAELMRKDQTAEPSPAARDVLAERARQISMEGWDFARDDRYVHGELSAAAGTYISWDHGEYKPGDVPINWPWALAWFKPTDLRRNLVKAGALILAEIERLDRAAPKGDSNG